MPNFDSHFFIQQNELPSIDKVSFKVQPADFMVKEILGFELSGEGEHLCVYVQKTNANTAQVASALAKWAGVANKDVSYCGLKDKFAITEQWFSIRIPTKKMPLSPFIYESEHASAHIINHQWHQKKLGRGFHKANEFTIMLSDIEYAQHSQNGESTDTVSGKQALVAQLTKIKSEGVPNYFMAQRFGHQGKNLHKALQLFTKPKRFKRDERSILISSARSYLFNHILSVRVNQNTWNKAVEGDVFNLNESNSIFVPEQIDTTIEQRVAEQDIHPTGVLWGSGELKSTSSMAMIENNVIQDANNSLLAEGLVSLGVKQSRRPLRMLVSELTWAFPTDTSLQLNFKLDTGCYATAVLAVLINNFLG